MGNAIRFPKRSPKLDRAIIAIDVATRPDLRLVPATSPGRTLDAAPAR